MEHVHVYDCVAILRGDFSLVGWRVWMAALVFTFADPKNFVLTQSLFHSLSSLCVERLAPRDHDVQLRKHTNLYVVTIMQS